MTRTLTSPVLHLVAAQFLIFLALHIVGSVSAAGRLATDTILDATFDTDAESFGFAPDVFRGTNEPEYASGSWTAVGGYGGGALRIDLGGVDNSNISGMSGGWSVTFNATGVDAVILSFRYHMTLSPDYENDEFSEVLVSVDDVLIGVGGNDYIVQLSGDGNGDNPTTSGWQVVALDLGTPTSGPHTLTLGGYNNEKTNTNESTEIIIDDVTIFIGSPPFVNAGPGAAVDSLSFLRFKQNLQTLSDFGDRSQSGAGSQSYTDAANWVEAELAAMGYTVEHHEFTFQGHPRSNIYVTKVGTVHPDRMYIVSAHLDGRGGGGAADDDGSGCTLLLEIARVLALDIFESDYSIRIIFWNNEETGLDGSEAYVDDRASLQGIEEPPGSGVYPEPIWLGIVQHDMILFDHGLPPQPNQIPEADLDVEYQLGSTFAFQSLGLADALHLGSGTYSTDYPAEVGSNMNNTDSKSFQNLTAAVSVRENQRIAEIGSGANPHWHQTSDVYETYSEDDLRLGFNAAQMTLGTIAELAGVRLTTPTGVGGTRGPLLLHVRPSAPEPFRSAAILQFELPTESRVTVRIYDVRGRLVRHLSDAVRPAGLHSVQWDGTTDSGARAASGTYFVHVLSPFGLATEKMTLVR